MKIKIDTMNVAMLMVEIFVLIVMVMTIYSNAMAIDRANKNEAVSKYIQENGIRMDIPEEGKWYPLNLVRHWVEFDGKMILVTAMEYCDIYSGQHIELYESGYDR